MSATAPSLVFTPLLTWLLAVECLLLLLGAGILIKGLRGAPARFLGLAPAGLGPSPFRPSELFLAAAFAFGGVIILQVATNQLAGRYFPKHTDGSLGMFEILQGAGFQIGLLAGLAHAWFWHLRPQKRPPEPSLPLTPELSPAQPASLPPAMPLASALRQGATTFLSLLPIVWLTGFLWQKLLDYLDVDAPPQDLVTLFAKTGDLPALGIMVALAVLVAPLTEELIFRIGLFRWLRTRTPRSVALFLPAVAFAALHGNVAVLLPLVVLAIGLALAYERDGHPLVPIIAHSLFNMNTVILLLAGLPV